MRKVIVGVLVVLIAGGAGFALTRSSQPDERAAPCEMTTQLASGWKPTSYLETFVAVSGAKNLLEQDVPLDSSSRSTSYGQNIPGGVLCIVLTSGEAEACGAYGQRIDGVAGQFDDLVLGPTVALWVKPVVVTAVFFHEDDIEPTSSRSFELMNCPNSISEAESGSVRQHSVAMSEILRGLPQY